MNHFKPKAVFFDCWSTLITFHVKDEDWNTHALKEHTLNRDTVDWAKVDSFADDFFDGYYASHSAYEITAHQFLSLLVRLFGLTLDTDIDTLTHDILTHLDPEPVKGIGDFLHYLDKEGIYYAVLSNTIYNDDDTLALIRKLIPAANPGFFLGSSDLGVKKPNPDFFRAGVLPTGYALADSMYVGDAFYQDVMGSHNAGFGASIWLNWKEKDFRGIENEPWAKDVRYTEVRSYDELREKIEKGQLA